MYIDIFLAIITMIIVFFSMKKGFFMEIFHIFSLLIAFWITKNYYYIISNSLLKGISNSTIRVLLSYTIMFVAVFIFALLIFSKIRDYVGRSKNINTIDKTMGGLFGILKSLLIFEIILLLIIKFEILTVSQITKNSYIGKFLVIVSNDLNLF
ncbi:MAG: CvpA family protein [Candidatus Mcinerneyibacterium aminivorans]|uniref:CvpA family protein n=1 Tax=Candidatus Mcinerneyibacterium aminivorans TaxID=2703815 RepID=A0A5D0MIM5_9BACT|nr:MAG: CvpA family protein [Candidatus Mcinerneyibacterium aminivorans]